MKIEISETVEDTDEMAALLQHIAALINEGYRSGYYPTWRIYTEGSD